jgi:hypothetical protein
VSNSRYLPKFRRIVLSSKSRYLSTSRHGAISQKTCISNSAAVRTWNRLLQVCFRDRSVKMVGHGQDHRRSVRTWGTYDVHRSSVRAVVTNTFWDIHTGACISPSLDELHQIFYTNVVLNPGCRKMWRHPHIFKIDFSAMKCNCLDPSDQCGLYVPQWPFVSHDANNKQLLCPCAAFTAWSFQRRARCIVYELRTHSYNAYF